MGDNYSERQHPRYATDLEAICEHPHGTLVGRTKNLSRGGLCLSAPESLTVGTPVITQLALMFDGNQRSESLRVDGRVCWCTALSGKFQIGIQFLSTNSEALSFLGLFMQFLEDGHEDKASDSFSSTTTFHSEDHSDDHDHDD